MLTLTILIFSTSIFLATARLAPTASESDSDVTTDDYFKFIIANTLQHGDPCSWSDEQYRQEGVNRINNLTKDSKTKNTLFDQLVKSTIQKGRTYCRTTSMLICDKEIEKCVCGEQQVQFYLQAKYKPSNYVAETDATTGNVACRWGRSAACSPPNLFAVETTKCAQGLDCVSSKNGELCTNTTIIESVVSAAREKKTYKEFTDDVINGKMCACAEVGGRIIAKKGKRSVGSNDNVYDNAVSAFMGTQFNM